MMFSISLLTVIGKAIFLNLFCGAIIWALVHLVKNVFTWRPAQLFRIYFIAQQVLGLLFLISVYLFHDDWYNLTQYPIPINMLKGKLVYILQFFSLIYLIWMAKRLISFMADWHSLRRFQTSEKASASWRMFIQQHVAILGIKREVTIWLTSQCHTSFTGGWLRPVIWLPASLATQLNHHQIEALILHELAHIKRNDYLWQMVSMFTDVVLCFNPFSRMLMVEMDGEREKACDDLVLQFQYPALKYAEALLVLAAGSENILAQAATGRSPGLLQERIERMLLHGFQSKKKKIFRKAIPVWLICLLFPLFMFFIALNTSHPVTDTTEIAEKKTLINNSRGQSNSYGIKPLRQEEKRPVVSAAKKEDSKEISSKQGSTVGSTVFKDMYSEDEIAYYKAIDEAINASDKEMADALRLSQQTHELSLDDQVVKLSPVDDYAITEAGTEKTIITPQIFDQLVQAYKYRKALSIPLLNGEIAESIELDEATSTLTRKVYKLVTIDTVGIEHNWTLEVNVFQ